MKTFLLLAMLMSVLSCHKSFVSQQRMCTTLVKSGDQVSVCPEKITDDSRCPPGVQCIWQGYALLHCRFTKNDSSTTIVLSTLRHPAVPVLPDTTVMGYRVELINLSASGSPLKAEIVITPQ